MTDMATTTTKYGYTKPAEGDLDWDTTLNANLDLLDADLGAQHNADGSHAAVVATSVDVNGGADALILDLDGDTTISAPTDDQIDIEINGADDFRLYANTFTALPGSVITTDTLNETTSGAGVTVDGVNVGNQQVGIFNVLDYGAVGDGVTDDTTAIQAALTALTSAGGGTLYFPAGTYAVDGASTTDETKVWASGGYKPCGLKLPSHCRVVLAHDATLLITDTLSWKSGLALENVDDIDICGGTIMCDWEAHWTADTTWTYASANTFTVVGDQSATYVVGKKLRWKQGGDYLYAVVLSSAYSGVTTVTINYGQPVANAAITDNSYGPVGEWGYGIFVLGATNVHIHDLAATTCWGDGIMIMQAYTGAEHATLVHSEHVAIDNVRCVGNLRNGLSVLDVSDLCVTNSLFSDMVVTSPAAGIDIEPDTDGTIISGVVIDANYFANNEMGIAVQPAAGVTTGLILSNNIIIGKGYRGILLSKSASAIVLDCHVINNSISDATLDSHHVATAIGAGINAAIPYIDIRGNTVHNCAKDGVYVYDCHSIRVTDNLIISNSQRATGVFDNLVLGTNVRDCLVMGNLIRKSDGHVAEVLLVSGGSDYTVDDILTVVQAGYGHGCTARATTVEAGVITAIELVEAGIGYTAAAGLGTTVSPSGGSDATITVALSTILPRYGIEITGVLGGNVITDNDITGGGDTANYHLTSGTVPTLRDNLGWLVYTRGTASVSLDAAGMGIITITGLAAAPTGALCVSATAGDIVAVTQLGSGYARIYVYQHDGTPVNATRTVYWQAWL